MIEKIIDGVIYLLDEETLTAEVIGGDGCKGDIEILKTVVLNDVSYRVTTIGPEAFSCCDSLTDITIPDTVTLIGSGAFSNCTSLTAVHISDLAAWCRIDFGVVSECSVGGY